MDPLDQSHNKNHHELVAQFPTSSLGKPLALPELKREQLSALIHLAHRVNQLR